MNEQEIIKFIQEHPEYGRMKIARHCNLSEGVARSYIRKVSSGSISPSATKGLSGAVDASRFIEAFDIPKKIREALPLLDGRVISDSDFRNSLKVDGTRWAKAREKDEFKEYQISIRSKKYWAHPDTIRELEDKIDVM